MFHYAFKVKDIASTRRFYIDIIGCKEGRSTDHWIDFNFFENQLSAHISAEVIKPDYCGLVDDIKIPIPHFGCLLSVEQFRVVQKSLETANIEFIIPPRIRYKNKVGEQLIMFVMDFSNNAIEFKVYSNSEGVFKS